MNIPNFVDMKVIDKDGFFTPEWKIIMQQLLTELQLNAGQEGLVAPTQDNANILKIQNNLKQIPNNIHPPPDLFTSIPTCQFGTLIYDNTNNVLWVALNNAGAPQFHQVVTL